MKKILITGGAGFIGSNLSLACLKKGYAVTVLDNLSPQIHGEKPETESPLYLSIKDKVNFINGSVTNKELFYDILKEQDVVVHFAAETGTGQSMYQIEKYCDVNIGGTAILLDLLTNRTHSIKKIVVASSRSIYGEGKYKCAEHGIVYPTARKEADMLSGKFECTCPICDKEVEILKTTEDSKIHPSSLYGITKQQQEQMVMVIGKALGIDTLAFRYQNVYGPGQSLSNPYTGILSIFSTIIKNGNDINIFEDGKESRDFVYIDDVVDATLKGIEYDEPINEIFNVGSGVATDVDTIASTLLKNYKANVDVKTSGNFRLGDIRHNIASLEKINKILKFSPSVSFNQGINNFCQWVNQQELKEDNYEKSILELKAKGLMK